MGQRLDTFDLDGGRCVGCGRKLRRNADAWEWQAHHVLKAQWLVKEGVPPARIKDSTFTVLVCRRCHERHESVTERIRLEQLPERVVKAADALGTWAQDRLRTYHPPRGFLIDGDGAGLPKGTL